MNSNNNSNKKKKPVELLSRKALKVFTETLQKGTQIEKMMNKVNDLANGV